MQPGESRKWIRCRERGRLTTVLRLLFTGEGRADLLYWLRYKWWAVLVVVAGLVAVLSVTVRCLAFPTPSSNPRRLGDTARRPLSALGLPAASQMRCCRRPVTAVFSSQQQPAEPQQSVSPPPP